MAASSISMASKTATVSAASVTASLISKLSLSNQEEPVDLGNLRCPKSGFVAQRFYLVGRLNTTRTIVFDAFRSVVRSMWRLPSPVEVQARDDRFLFTFASERDVNRVKRGGPWAYQRAMIILNDYDGFSDIRSVPLDSVWIWVGIQGLPAALSTVATARLVAETIGVVLQVDHGGFQRGLARVRVTLPLNQPVRLDRRIRVSPMDVLQVTYKYERLIGRCRTCSMLNHGGETCPLESEEVVPPTSAPSRATGLPPMIFRGNSAPNLIVPNSPTLASLFPKEKRVVQIRDVPAFSSPAKVAGVRRSREEEVTPVGKRARHALTFDPLPLNPEELGFSIADGGALGLKKTGKSPKKKGRPRGSRNKKNLQVGECSDSMAPTMGEITAVDNGLESEANEE